MGRRTDGALCPCCLQRPAAHSLGPMRSQTLPAEPHQAWACFGETPWTEEKDPPRDFRKAGTGVPQAVPCLGFASSAVNRGHQFGRGGSLPGWGMP